MRPMAVRMATEAPMANCPTTPWSIQRQAVRVYHKTFWMKSVYSTHHSRPVPSMCGNANLGLGGIVVCVTQQEAILIPWYFSLGGCTTTEALRFSFHTFCQCAPIGPIVKYVSSHWPIIAWRSRRRNEGKHYIAFGHYSIGQYLSFSSITNRLLAWPICCQSSVSTTPR